MIIKFKKKIKKDFLLKKSLDWLKLYNKQNIIEPNNGNNVYTALSKLQKKLTWKKREQIIISKSLFFLSKLRLCNNKKNIIDGRNLKTEAEGINIEPLSSAYPKFANNKKVKKTVIRKLGNTIFFLIDLKKIRKKNVKNKIIIPVNTISGLKFNNNDKCLINNKFKYPYWDTVSIRSSPPLIIELIGPKYHE